MENGSVKYHVIRVVHSSIGETMTVLYEGNLFAGTAARTVAEELNRGVARENATSADTIVYKVRRVDSEPVAA